MSDELRIEEWQDADISHLTDIIIAAFGPSGFGQFVQLDSEHKAAIGEAHLQGVHAHSVTGIKCIHKDPSTTKGTIIATAEWTFASCPQPLISKSSPEILEAHYLLTVPWISNPTRQAQAIQMMQPLVSLRHAWMGSRRHAYLLYMATDPAWTRRGAATQCVAWGLAMCEQEGIPAYLEASVQGLMVYRRLGFEVVESVHVGAGKGVEEVAIMVWWPPGMGGEERKKIGV